jgi:uncharacterized protein
MPAERLTPEERRLLLHFARQSIESALDGREFLPPDLGSLSPSLREEGVCFVTLTCQGGELRGCIGGLEAVQPLAVDVCKHAAAAAFEDYRFAPVRRNELSAICIEISRLTPPEPLDYGSPTELLSLFRPMVDGVVIRDGRRRSTFLPQVWEKLPDPEIFLNHLCQKMGAQPDLWRKKKLQVERYQVEEFSDQHV